MQETDLLGDLLNSNPNEPASKLHGIDKSLHLVAEQVAILVREVTKISNR
ncbi:MAG: hypothetical protein AABZ06_09145 [Bdellovibrionota bacterium]